MPAAVTHNKNEMLATAHACFMPDINQARRSEKAVSGARAA